MLDKKPKETTIQNIFGNLALLDIINIIASFLVSSIVRIEGYQYSKIQDWIGFSKINTICELATSKQIKNLRIEAWIKPTESLNIPRLVFSNVEIGFMSPCWMKFFQNHEYSFAKLTKLVLAIDYNDCDREERSLGLLKFMYYTNAKITHIEPWRLTKCRCNNFMEKIGCKKIGSRIWGPNLYQYNRLKRGRIGAFECRKKIKI